MNLFSMAWRFLWSKRAITLATLVALALPTTLAVLLLVVRHQSEGALKKGAGDLDLIIGAKGGAMQLVLSSLYHLGMPSGNILYSDYEELLKDKRVKAAVPIGLGDNYEGYRIVGTEPHLFDLQDYADTPLMQFREGEAFQKGTYQAVIGAQVAAETGLSMGDPFHGTHGLITVPGAEVHTDFTYHVVGILEPTGQAHDRAIYIPISAVWKVHHAEESIHHVFRQSTPIKQEVTSILVQLESAGLRLWMLDELKKKPNLMVAVPINEILSLSRIYLAPFQKLLLLVTIGVIIVSSIVIVLALYQAVERRERTLLTLRSLGATRVEIMRLLFYEVALLILTGVSLGALTGHLAVQGLSPYIYQKTGLIITAWHLAPGELLTLSSITLVLFLVGLFPTLSLYRKSVV